MCRVLLANYFSNRGSKATTFFLFPWLFLVHFASGRWTHIFLSSLKTRLLAPPWTKAFKDAGYQYVVHCFKAQPFWSHLCAVDLFNPLPSMNHYHVENFKHFAKLHSITNQQHANKFVSVTNLNCC